MPSRALLPDRGGRPRSRPGVRPSSYTKKLPSVREPRRPTAEAREHAFLRHSEGKPGSFPSENGPLGLFFDLVNDHPTRLIIRERLWVITVARMHPHAGSYDPATAGPRFFDRAG